MYLRSFAEVRLSLAHSISISSRAGGKNGDKSKNVINLPQTVTRTDGNRYISKNYSNANPD